MGKTMSRNPAGRRNQWAWTVLAALGLATALPIGTLNRSVLALQATRPPRTPMELFAARPTAKLIWSAAIGQLESPKTRVTFTAVAYEDPSATPSITRGVRIGFEHLVPNPDCWDRFGNDLCYRPNASLLLDEKTLAAARPAVIRGNWDNLIFGFGRSSTFDGVIIAGYIVDGKVPSDVVVLIDRVTVELTKAPR